jgi:hypothetical protein
LATPVIFPPAGSTVSGTMITPEWPDPLAACPGYHLPIGIPVTVQMGALVKVLVKSYLLRDETEGQRVEACGFDYSSYPQESGRQILLTYGAVVVIPRKPLSAGHTYSLNLNTQHQTFKWAFRAEGTGSRT